MWSTRLPIGLAMVLSATTTKTTTGVWSMADGDTIGDTMRAVSAQDDRWHAVLKQRVRVDRTGLGGDSVTVSVQETVTRLATDATTATVSELRYGAAVLAAGLSCEFARTLLLHTYFVSVLGLYDRAYAPTLRWCLSAVQVALAVYVDKLVALGHDVGPYVRFNGSVNDAFAAHDARPAMDTAEFVAHVDRLVAELAAGPLAERCAGVGETIDVVTTVRRTADDHGPPEEFGGRSVVGHDRLVAMIRDVDPYEYADFRNVGPDVWMSRLNINVYARPVVHRYADDY